MIDFKTLFAIASAGAFLSGCGAKIEPSRPSDPQFFIGTSSASISANGLPFADGTQTLEDVEGELLTVRIARFERDPELGTTRLVATNETATLPSTFTSFDDFDATITFNGAPLTFVDGVAELPSGQRVWSYMNFGMVHSGTGGLYTYASLDPEATDPIDMEGFFTLGFETAPDVIAARSEQITYLGSYFGYAQTFDADGELLSPEVRTIGAIRLEAEFAQSRVSGRLEGRLDPMGDEVPYELIFLGAPIRGNGFVGAADITCPSGHTCRSRTAVGGAFYGPNGEEVSGVIGFDEEIEGPEGLRFIGAAGFSSTSEPPE